MFGVLPEVIKTDIIDYNRNMKLKHLFFLGLVAMATVKSAAADDKFPDGTVVPEWFRNISVPTLAEQGKAYVITDYGVVNDSTIIQTEKIQAVIDKAAQEKVPSSAVRFSSVRVQTFI